MPVLDPAARRLLLKYGANPDEYEDESQPTVDSTPVAEETGPVQQNPSFSNRTSGPGTALREFRNRAVPAVSGLGMTGLTMSALTPPLTVGMGPIAGPLTAGAASVVTGLAMAYGTEGMQDWLLEKALSAEDYKAWKEQQQIDAQEHPHWKTLGGAATSAIGMKPSFGPFAGSGRAIRDSVASIRAPATRVHAEDLNDLFNVTTSAALPAGMRAINDPTATAGDIILEGLLGSGFNNPNKLAQKFGFLPNTPRTMTEAENLKGIAKAQTKYGFDPESPVIEVGDPAVDPVDLKLTPKGITADPLTERELKIAALLNRSEADYLALSPETRATLSKMALDEILSIGDNIDVGKNLEKLAAVPKAKPVAPDVQQDPIVKLIDDAVEAAKATKQPLKIPDVIQDPNINLTGEALAASKLPKPGAADQAVQQEGHVAGTEEMVRLRQEELAARQAIKDRQAALEAQFEATGNLTKLQQVVAKSIGMSPQDFANLPKNARAGAVKAYKNKQAAALEAEIQGNRTRALEEAEAKAKAAVLEKQITAKERDVAEKVGVPIKEFYGWSAENRAKLVADFEAGKVKEVARAEGTPLADMGNKTTKQSNDEIKRIINLRQLVAQRSKVLAERFRNLGKKRGVNVITDTVLNSEGQPTQGNMHYRKGIEEALARISDTHGTIDIDAHELLHQHIRDLKKFGNDAEVRLAKEAERIVEMSPEFKEWQKTTKSKNPNAEEYLAEGGGIDIVRRGLRTDDKGPMRNWYEDYKAQVRLNKGKATEADAVKFLSGKLLNDPGFYEAYAPNYRPNVRADGTEYKPEETPPVEPTPSSEPAPVRIVPRTEATPPAPVDSIPAPVDIDADASSKASAAEGTPLARETSEASDTPLSNPNFKRNFKDTQVVDEQGNPQRMYHATQRSGFNVFHENSHFGTAEQANNLLESKGKVRDNFKKKYKLTDAYLNERTREFGSKDSIYPVYLNIKNAKEVDDVGGAYNWDKEIAKAKKEGYDGLKYRNTEEGEGYSWLAFYPEQVKSATGNKGAYDPRNPDFNEAVNTPLATEEGKAWFKQSEVVDADGKPRDMYHVNKAGKLTKFEDKYKSDLSSMGYHFGTSEQARNRTLHNDFRSYSPATGKYHLSIQNALDVSHWQASHPDHLADKMMDMGILTEDQFLKIREKSNSEPAVGRKLVSILRKHGYDGLKYDNIIEGEGKSYVPFDSTQIKSAISNTGEYGQKNPNVSEASDTPLREVAEANPQIIKPPAGTLKASRAKQNFMGDADATPPRNSNLPPKFQSPRREPEFILGKAASEIDKVRANNTPETDLIADSMTDFHEVLAENRGKFNNEFIVPARKMAGIDVLSMVGSPKSKGMGYLKQNTPELLRSTSYFDSFSDKSIPRPNLTPKEQELVDLARKSLKQVHEEVKSRPSLKDPGVFDENNLPHVPNNRVMSEIEQRPHGEKGSAYINEFLDYHKKLAPAGANKDQYAQAQLDEFRKNWSLSREVDKGSFFGPIDGKEQVKLPPSWEEQNLMVRMDRYLERVSRRLAYEDTMTSPELKKALNVYGRNESVRTVLDSIAGKRGKAEEWRDAATGLLKATKIGTESGLREGSTGLTLGWQHMQNPIQAVKSVANAWENMKSNYAESFKSGRNRNIMDVMEIGDGSEGFTTGKVLEKLLRARNIIGEVSAKNFLEHGIRATNFGQGKYLAQDFMIQHQNGKLSKMGEKFFDDFGRGIDWKKGHLTPEELNKIGGRFVDSVQGTYDYRGQPKQTMEGSWSPVLALSRWSVEKMNNYNKYVINPARNKNFTPLLMSTAGMILGGSAAKEIHELITGNKDSAATIKELWEMPKDGKFAKELAYKFAGLAQYSGTAGMASDLVKAVADEIYGKTKPFWYNNMLLESIGEAKDITMKFVETAIEEGPSPELMAEYLGKLLSNNIQNWRIIGERVQQAAGSDKIDKRNKLRDLRVFDRTHGNDISDQTIDFKPTYNTDIRKFKNTTDLKEANELIPKLTRKAFDKAEGDPDKFDKQLQKLKGATYDTMPNFENDFEKFAEYYRWLKDTQGKKEADKRALDYLEHQEINDQKESLIP